MSTCYNKRAAGGAAIKLTACGAVRTPVITINRGHLYEVMTINRGHLYEVITINRRHLYEVITINRGHLYEVITINRGHLYEVITINRGHLLCLSFITNTYRHFAYPRRSFSVSSRFPISLYHLSPI